MGISVKERGLAGCETFDDWQAWHERRQREKILQLRREVATLKGLIFLKQSGLREGLDIVECPACGSRRLLKQ